MPKQTAEGALPNHPSATQLAKTTKQPTNGPNHKIRSARDCPRSEAKAQRSCARSEGAKVAGRETRQAKRPSRAGATSRTPTHNPKPKPKKTVTLKHLITELQTAASIVGELAPVTTDRLLRIDEVQLRAGTVLLTLEEPPLRPRQPEEWQHHPSEHHALEPQTAQ
jgi:hypothetical protein